MSKVDVLIPTRLKSTRLPNKPLAMINGKPLIQHVYEHAIKVHPAEDVYIAAGDKEIVDLANEFEPTLFSINSNGRLMNSAIRENSFNGWFDLSKHSIDDRGIFLRDTIVGKDDILEYIEYFVENLPIE